MTPEPGSTRARSSSNTAVRSVIMNRRPPLAAPGASIPWNPVSVDPKFSATIVVGSRPRTCSFTASDSTAPVEPKYTSEDRSHRPGFAARDSASGRAMESPTRVMVVTCGRAVGSHTAAGSNRGRRHRRRRPATSSALPPPSRLDAGSRPVVDVQERLQQRQPAFDRRDAGGELPLVDHADQVRVVEQVRQLPLDVAVVHVDGHGPDLQAPQHCLDVLGPVVEVQPDVLAGLYAGVAEVVGDAVRALVELRVVQAAVAAGRRLAVA